MSLTDGSLNVQDIECTNLYIKGTSFSNNFITQARQKVATYIMNQINNASTSTIDATMDANGERVQISYTTINHVQVNSATSYLKVDTNNELSIAYPLDSTWDWWNHFSSGGSNNYFPVRFGGSILTTHGSEVWWSSTKIKFDIGGGTNNATQAGGQAFLYAKRKNGGNYYDQYFWVQGTTRNNNAEYSKRGVGWDAAFGDSDVGLLGIPEDDIPVNIVSSFGTTTESDKRLKENILPIKNAMKSIKKVNIVQYEIRHKYNYPPCIGVIAQELEEIKDPLLMLTVEIPEYIEENPYKVAEYSLFSTNIKALQEFNQDFIKEKKETIEMLNILDEKINILENKLS